MGGGVGRERWHPTAGGQRLQHAHSLGRRAHETMRAAPAVQSSLFKLVSFITGWKNSLKGAGYFLGAATLGVRCHARAVLALLCQRAPKAVRWLHSNHFVLRENVTESALCKSGSGTLCSFSV